MITRYLCGAKDDPLVGVSEEISSKELKTFDEFLGVRETLRGQALESIL